MKKVAGRQCANIRAMAARERLPPWHERQTLANGREVLIRPIRPEDAEPLRAGFELLQPDEVRQRFLHSLKEMTPEMAERFTRINPKTEFALVAAEPLPPGEALVGAVARWRSTPPAAMANSRSWSAATSPAWAWAAT